MVDSVCKTHHSLKDFATCIFFVNSADLEDPYSTVSQSLHCLQSYHFGNA